MKNVDWPANEIAKVASSSGKPLEVLCAQAFIAAGWTVDLGSYFADGDRVREFDVLATRERNCDVDGTAVPLRIRAFLSCKGCRPTRSPLAYSVSASSVPPCEPRMRSHHRINTRLGRFNESYGKIDALERESAAQLLAASQLTNSRPLVAFDMIEREEITNKRNQTTEVSFDSVGDKDLYEGIDSALKASSYWIVADNQTGTQCMTLYVPVLLLADPFWDVCIDGGKVGTAEIRRRAFQSCRYPIESLKTGEVTILVWSADELAALLSALDATLRWFAANALKFLSK